MNNKIFCRTLTSLFACLMTGTMLIPAFSVSAATKIAINEKNFPDKNFRKALKDNYDEGDGYLSSDIWELEVEECGIKDLKGIELLPNLGKLWCSGNEITSLDLSKNTYLCDLRINFNKIVKLDLSKNTELDYLRCEGNLLETLDLSKNTRLMVLNIDNNKIDKIDLSKNTNLDYLYCGGNLFETLDLSKNTKLKELRCGGNLLKNLDLSKNTGLRWLSVNDNKLDKLDLSSAHALLDLDCSNNAITSLNLESCIKLDELICNNNKLTSLDLSANSALDVLYCQGNQIDKLDVSSCKYLVKALAGKKEQKNGYVVYAYKDDYKLAVDNKTIVKVNAQTIVDDKTKHMFLNQGAVVFLGFEGTEDQTQVKLSSSDKSVVKIGEYNSLITLKAGSSNITAKVGDKEYKFKVTVYYEDVKDNSKFWFEPTYALTEKGVVKGYDNQTSFKPANKCTRAQMVTFIWRLMGSPEPKNKDCSFPDVKKGDYFYKACIWGNENHIVEGYKDGTFGPQIVCARRHAVTFLWRLAGKPEPTGDKTKFIDVFKDIDEDDYFFKATIWATEQKIVAGYSDNTFRPNNDCLRRQMVTFLYKFDKYVGVKK